MSLTPSALIHALPAQIEPAHHLANSPPAPALTVPAADAIVLVRALVFYALHLVFFSGSGARRRLPARARADGASGRRARPRPRQR
jgi:hypothetical protein